MYRAVAQLSSTVVSPREKDEGGLIVVFCYPENVFSQRCTVREWEAKCCTKGNRPWEQMSSGRGDNRGWGISILGNTKSSSGQYTEQHDYTLMVALLWLGAELETSRGLFQTKFAMILWLTMRLQWPWWPCGAGEKPCGAGVNIALQAFMWSFQYWKHCQKTSGGVLLMARESFLWRWKHR